MTDEALDELTRQVMIDALRTEWENTGQDDTFAPSKKYWDETRELLADPNKWYKKKTEPVWRRYVRQLSAFAAIVAVCIAAVWLLPDGGEAAAQAPIALGGIWGVLLAVVSWIIYRKSKQ